MKKIFKIIKSIISTIKEIKNIDLSREDELKDMAIDPNSKPI